MIGFQREINLIFSLFNEGDNIVFSPLRYRKRIIYKLTLIQYDYEQKQLCFYQQRMVGKNG